MASLSRLRRVFLPALVLVIAGGIAGCCWICRSHSVSCHADPAYPALAFAVERALHTIHGQYSSCLPPNYETSAFLGDLQAHHASEDELQTLRSVGLEIWTDQECSGYVLVARSTVSGRVLLWDRSTTRARLDGPSVEGRPPEAPPPRTPPASCTCTSARN
jgi:hypothetical protein